jgi:hypothetical protein
MPQLCTVMIAALNHWHDPSQESRRNQENTSDNLLWTFRGVLGGTLFLTAASTTGGRAFSRCIWNSLGIRELIEKLWGMAWDMWEHCNDILHKTITRAKYGYADQTTIYDGHRWLTAKRCTLNECPGKGPTIQFGC